MGISFISFYVNFEYVQRGCGFSFTLNMDILYRPALLQLSWNDALLARKNLDTNLGKNGLYEYNPKTKVSKYYF